MLISCNIEDLLLQGIAPVPTTDKSIYALTITQPSGTPLSTVTLPKQNQCTLTKVKMYALLAIRQGVSEEVTKFDVDNKDVYCALVPKTRFGVVAVCEKDFPEGLLKMRLRSLMANLSELQKFDEEDDYTDGYNY